MAAGKALQRPKSRGARVLAEPLHGEGNSERKRCNERGNGMDGIDDDSWTEERESVCACERFNGS